MRFEIKSKPEEYKINDEVFKIRPFNMGEEHLLTANNIKEMILAALKQTDDSITKEDVDELPFYLANEIVEVILKANHIDMPSKEK